MAFRNFSAVLDALPAGPPPEDDFGRVPTVPFDHLAVVDELHSGRIVISQDMVAQEYLDAARLSEAELHALLDGIVIETGPALTARLSTDPADIARELALDGLDLDGLTQLRRRFAFANHPDRLAAPQRQIGMVRMQVANMLIDEACRRLR
ncbi:MAG: hypothetical protein KF914_06160 [Rhizobiaceae bacterium]|nr:hypothetical protein [Rhizobiaceae bacterium]